jgi:hypothetical protein
MSSIGMARLSDLFVAAVFALTVPSIALAASICLPLLDAAGDSINCEVSVNPDDPTPIIIDLPPVGDGADLGAVQQVTLSGAPDAAGTAVIYGNSLVIRMVSPPATLGLSSAPVIAVTVAVPDQGPAGTTASLPPAPAASALLAPFGAPCDQVTPLAQGTVSVTGVLPDGGVLPAGSLVAVVGIGFQPDAQVLIDGVAIASTSWVDSSRIEVVTAADAQLDGRRVDVSNPDGTGASYSSQLRFTDLGKSATPLLATTEAIFPVTTQSRALVAAPTRGTFFALALQNPQPVESIVSVELWDTGLLVASASLALPPLTKVSREVSELFAGVIPGAGSFFRLTATVPVQVLGLSGDENEGSVTPVLPALACP